MRLPAMMITWGRCPRRVRTICSSRSGERSATATVGINPRACAAVITPAAIDEKYGSSMSLTTRAAVRVEPNAIACADRCGW
jgi:hypothetical protein